MKRLFLLMVCFGLFLGNAFSQEINPAPTPPPVDESAIKIPTTLIQVDVSVTDANGRIVEDLKPEDFEVYENGVRQNVTTFSFVSSVRTKTETPKESKNNIAVPVPTAVLRAEQVRRTFALVVDDLSLSFESAARVRMALKKFVDEQMQAGDLVAIIRTGAGIGALQQFTTDKRQLYAAIEKVRWNPSGKGKLSSFNPLEPTMLEQAQAMGDTEVTEEDIRQEKDFQEGFDDFQGSIFSTGTLGALKFIVGGMQNLKGKKSVVLFSDGLQIFNKSENSAEGASRIEEFLKQLVNLANSYSVVFYTIDARGLETTNLTVQDRVVRKTGQTYSDSISERSAELFNTQDGLVYLARETGGRAFVNRNDMNGSIDKVLDDQSYYLLGYQPDAEKFDENKSRFNKLEVKVLRAGVNVRYRTGFFGKPNENAVRPSKLTTAQQLSNALASPFGYNDITLRFNTVFNNEKKQGSYVRSLLHVDARDLKFTDEAGGIKKTTFEVLGVSFGDNGVPVDQITNSYSLTVKNENFAKMLSEGFVYYFTFPIKKPGAYQLRVALRDSVSGRIGSASQFIEIPNLKKSALTVSSLVLENMSVEKWRKISAGSQKTTWTNQAPDAATLTNRMIDTSLRKFKRNSVLRYGFEVYNAKLSDRNKPNLTTQLRLFRDGQLVLEGEKIPLELFEQKDYERTWGLGAVDLGSQTPSGDYILQIVVIDNLAKEKRKIATQFVQFEIIE